MCLNLSDHQLDIDCCIVRMLYMNFMVATNQKPVTDTQKKNKRKDPSIRLKKVISCKGQEQEERKREEPQSKPEEI